jgi:hypothetical protein
MRVSRAVRTLVSHTHQSKSCGRLRLLLWVAVPADPIGCLQLSKASSKIGGDRYAQPQNRREQDRLVSRHDRATIKFAPADNL